MRSAGSQVFSLELRIQGEPYNPFRKADWFQTRTHRSLTNCSAQRQTSEQRPVQQPMVRPASQQRRLREIWELRLYPATSEQPALLALLLGAGSGPRGRLSAFGAGLAAAFVNLRAGRAEVSAARPCGASAGVPTS